MKRTHLEFMKYWFGDIMFNLNSVSPATWNPARYFANMALKKYLYHKKIWENQVTKGAST